MPHETSVIGIGRFDIFVSARMLDHLGQSRRLNLIIELKIDSRADADQSETYANWLFTNHPDDVNIVLHITPKVSETACATAGDERWHCIEYQLLHDKLLLPLLDHPALNEKVRPFIIQYMKNLKTRYRGMRMAITEEEKRLAVALYEKYSDVFDSIYDALVSTGTVDYGTSELMPSTGRESGRLAVRMNGTVFSSQTLGELIENILKYLVDNGLLMTLPMPWGTGNQRYIITNEEPAIHPNGRPFFYPVKYKGYTMESHYSRARGIQVLESLCAKLELDFERIET